jgi:hypothetical protein
MGKTESHNGLDRVGRADLAFPSAANWDLEQMGVLRQFLGVSRAGLPAKAPLLPQYRFNDG